MRKPVERLIVASALTAAATIVGVNGASAAVCFSPPDSCTAGTEQMVFLESTSNGTTVMGNVGSQTGTPVVDFTSTSALDAANGFANITPHTGSDFTAPLAVTVPGFTFTDLDFSVQLFNSMASPDLTITAMNGSTVLGSQSYTSQKHDADLDFLLQSTSPITSVVLSTDTGFKELKQFELSGLDPVGVGVAATPAPAALPLFVSGLGALGLFGWRKKRKGGASLLGTA